MLQAVRTALENTKSGKSAGARTGDCIAWSQNQLQIKLQCFSDIIFPITSHLFFNLQQAGVPEGEVLKLLPCLRKQTVTSNFQQIANKRHPCKSGRSPRLRAFALGLFSHYWARPMAADIQRQFGATFGGLVDYPLPLASA